jgi:hypothetical protein
MVTIGAKLVLMVALLAQATLPSAGGEDKAKAKALLAEGLTANRQGQHGLALEKFQAAYAAYPSPKLWFNIGQVEIALDHPVAAIEAFEKFLALVPAAQPDEKKVAKSAVDQLGKKLGRLQLRCETTGAEVAVDGKTVGKLPLPGPLWAAPGSHQVSVTHEGFAPATETVETTAGAMTLVVIRLVPNAPQVPAMPPPASEPAPEAPVPEVPASPASIPPPAFVPAPVPPPALDLSAQPAATEAPSEARPIYKTWWFWTGAAVVVAGAVTTAVLVARQGGSNVPETPLGNHGVFQ